MPTDPTDLHRRRDDLVDLSATLVGKFDEPEGHWIKLLDSAGNGF